MIPYNPSSNLVNLGGGAPGGGMPTFGANPPRRIMPGPAQPAMPTFGADPPGRVMPSPMPGQPQPWGAQPPIHVGPEMPAMPVAGASTFGANPPGRIMPGNTPGNMMNMGDFLRRPVMGYR